MIFSLLEEAEKEWRDIARLATPLDSDKPVVLGKKPRAGDFEAYTDNRKIFINVDEAKFKKNVENIIIPAYKAHTHKLYGVSKAVSDAEAFRSLVLDTFLFAHFHEQFHPRLCPNSKQDERKITKALYDGAKKAEPRLSKAQLLAKVNNTKNLIWDVVLNVSFNSKTAGYNNDDLETKISYVFGKIPREIDAQKILNYPSGILPILYIISANNRTTDIPISLVGGFYSTLSFNDANIRQKALDFFLDDLQSKKMVKTDAVDVMKKMYLRLASELDANELVRLGIDKTMYDKMANSIDDISAGNYNANQQFLVSTLTKIFDTPSLRYDSLKGLMKVISPFVSLTQKQGSPDPNTMGGSGSGSSDDDSDRGGGGSGDSDDDSESDDRTQDEMDAGSMGDTLDDLLEELGGKDADDLLGEIANGMGGAGYGIGSAPGSGVAKVSKMVGIQAADEFYKKNAEPIEMRNPTEKMDSIDIGDKRVWKHVRTDNLTATDVSRLNHGKIATFQKSTGLPVLMNAGAGFFKLNEYVLKTIPQKSYTFSQAGLEIPNNWVVIQDSSGSMASGADVGSGSKFDVLNRVKYGLQNELYRVCKLLGKDLKFGVVNFSDVTQYSGLDSLIKVHEARSHHIKDVSLIPQCGGTDLNSSVFAKVRKDLAPGRSVYTIITDGEIFGDTTKIYNELERFASEPNNAVVFVEIASRSSFGASVETLSKANPSVSYYSVNDIKSIKDKLGKVLVQFK